MANARVRVGGQIADDVLGDVFARLPGVQDILRCACTCKRWRRLVTDRAFLRRVGLWPETSAHPSVLAGIFSQSMYRFNGVEPLGRKPESFPQFLSLQAGGAAAHLNFNSFVVDDDGLFNNARPLASRRGFLLVRAILPAEADGRDRLHLAVCRPLVDKRYTRLLPPPPIDLHWNFDSGLTGCAILTGADHTDGAGDLDQQEQSAFQVLLTYSEGDGFVSAYTYSSATDSWSAHIKCCRAPNLTKRGPRAGVVARGLVHWLYRDETNYYTLNVSVATVQVSFTKIPIKVLAVGVPNPRPPIPCIDGDGRLSLVNIGDHGVLEFWIKQEEDHCVHDCESEEDWLRSELTDLGRERLGLVFFAESRGALLVEQGGAFFTVDLKSKNKAQVNLKGEETHSVRGKRRFPAEYCSSSFCSGHIGRNICEETPPVLYEMDWIFTSRMFLSPCVDDSRLG